MVVFHAAIEIGHALMERLHVCAQKVVVFHILIVTEETKELFVDIQVDVLAEIVVHAFDLIDFLQGVRVENPCDIGYPLSIFDGGCYRWEGLGDLHV